MAGILYHTRTLYGANGFLRSRSETAAKPANEPANETAGR